MPAGAEQAILKGITSFGGSKKKTRVQLLLWNDLARSHCRRRAARSRLGRGCGSGHSSFTELRAKGSVERRTCSIRRGSPRSVRDQCLDNREGPVIAATDYMKTFADPDSIVYSPSRVYRALGTDGYGARIPARLRQFFEVNRYFVTVAALKALADQAKSN